MTSRAFLLVLFILIFLPVAFSACNCPASGNWAVTGTETCSDASCTLAGNLTISGNLTFDNYTLLMNLSSGGQYGIYVQNGGDMVIGNASNITALNTNNKFIFQVADGATDFDFTDSYLSDCGIAAVKENTGLFIEADNINISNVTITNSFIGIYLYTASNNTLTNNTIYSTTQHGIYLRNSSNNNTLTNNTVYSTSWHGFYVLISTNNTLTNNTVYTNSYDGFAIQSTNNTLTNNTVYNNSHSGFFVLEATNNTFTNNTIYNNTWSGVRLDTSSTNNTFTNNTVYNNSDGFNLTGSSHNNTFTNNTVYNNSDAGFDLDSSWDCTLTGNNITENIKGIDLSGITEDNRTTITNNSIYNNTNFEIMNGNSEEGGTNATNNWWGTVDCSAISDKIYDADDEDIGAVYYNPILNDSYPNGVSKYCPVINSVKLNVTSLGASHDILFLVNATDGDDDQDECNFSTYSASVSGNISSLDIANTLSQSGNVSCNDTAGLNGVRYFVNFTLTNNSYQENDTGKNIASQTVKKPDLVTSNSSKNLLYNVTHTNFTGGTLSTGGVFNGTLLNTLPAYTSNATLRSEWTGDWITNTTEWSYHNTTNQDRIQHNHTWLYIHVNVTTNNTGTIDFTDVWYNHSDANSDTNFTGGALNISFNVTAGSTTQVLPNYRTNLTGTKASASQCSGWYGSNYRYTWNNSNTLNVTTLKLAFDINPADKREKVLFCNNSWGNCTSCSDPWVSVTYSGGVGEILRDGSLTNEHLSQIRYTISFETTAGGGGAGGGGGYTPLRCPEGSIWSDEEGKCIIAMLTFDPTLIEDNLTAGETKTYNVSVTNMLDVPVLVKLRPTVSWVFASPFEFALAADETREIGVKVLTYISGNVSIKSYVDDAYAGSLPLSINTTGIGFDISKAFLGIPMPELKEKLNEEWMNFPVKYILSVLLGAVAAFFWRKESRRYMKAWKWVSYGSVILIGLVFYVSGV